MITFKWFRGYLGKICRSFVSRNDYSYSWRVNPSLNPKIKRLDNVTKRLWKWLQDIFVKDTSSSSQLLHAKRLFVHACSSLLSMWMYLSIFLDFLHFDTSKVLHHLEQTNNNIHKRLLCLIWTLKWLETFIIFVAIGFPIWEKNIG